MNQILQTAEVAKIRGVDEPTLGRARAYKMRDNPAVNIDVWNCRHLLHYRRAVTPAFLAKRGS